MFLLFQSFLISQLFPKNNLPTHYQPFLSFLAWLSDFLSLFTASTVFEKTPYQVLINHFSLSLLDCPTSSESFLDTPWDTFVWWIFVCYFSHSPLSSLFYQDWVNKVKWDILPCPKTVVVGLRRSRTVASISVSVSMSLVNQYFDTRVFLVGLWSLNQHFVRKGRCIHCAVAGWLPTIESLVHHSQIRLFQNLCFTCSLSHQTSDVMFTWGMEILNIGRYGNRNIGSYGSEWM